MNTNVRWKIVQNPMQKRLDIYTLSAYNYDIKNNNTIYGGREYEKDHRIASEHPYGLLAGCLRVQAAGYGFVKG